MRHITTIAILSLLLILIMANNIPHGAELYAQISQRDQATIEPIYQGYFVMFLFDISVLVMIFCGDSGVSVALAILLFIANIFFWQVPEDIYNGLNLSVSQWKLAVWKAALSGTFSFLLHRISELVRHYVRSLQIAIRRQRTRSETKETASAHIQNVSYACPNCQRPFLTQNALNAHKKNCKNL